MTFALANFILFFTKRKPVLKEKVSRENLCNLVVINFGMAIVSHFYI